MAALWSLLVLATLASSDAASLQFLPPTPDRPTSLYRAPSPYQESGRPPLNSVIITSKPFNIGSTSTTPSTPVRLSLDCQPGKSCSGTLPHHDEVASASVTPSPYQQEVLEKFLKELEAARRETMKKQGSTSGSLSKDRVNDRENKLDYAHSRVESNREPSDSVATNRLANLDLNNDDDSENNSENSENSSESHSDEQLEQDEDKDDRWRLLEAQRHNHPYDDRHGWVTLDRVPWSSGKVSKWQPSKPKPSHWGDFPKPPDRWDHRPPVSSSHNHYPHEDDRPYSHHRPHDDDRPFSHHHPNDHDRPHHPYGVGGHADIITDGGWPNFPSHPGGGNHHHRPPWSSSSSSSSSSSEEDSYNHHKYPQYHYGPPVEPEYQYHHAEKDHPYHSHHSSPSEHPVEGEGQWVLLSTTKGYSLPHRHKIFQRALTFNAKPITSRRTVRLTVLPAANSTTNTTISHNGLLEVQSTIQSVEQDARNGDNKQISVMPMKVTEERPNATESRELMPVQLVAASRPARDPSATSKAMLAAVGAGMVPATMAVLMPMIMGKRRRRSIIADETNRTPWMYENLHRRRWR